MKSSTRSNRVLLELVLGLLAAGLVLGCNAASEPEHVRVTILSGTPYERGLVHGREHSSAIRSLYTRLLSSSIVPYLNREQLNIAPVLQTYNGEAYRDGAFSRRMMLESGYGLLEGDFIPPALVEEMHGIADGAGVDFDEILILNTFFDTMMGFRSIVMLIQQIQEPYLASVGFDVDNPADGVDNDGDGTVDDADDFTKDAYRSSPNGLFVEVPPSAALRLVLRDPTLPGLGCLDPRNVEPFGELQIERRCVREACLKPECAGRVQVDRDCFFEATGASTGEPVNTCLEPRIAGVCLDPLCVQSTDPGCVDPSSIRITVDGALHVAGDGSFTVTRLPLGEGEKPVEDPDHPHALKCEGPLEVVFAPPGGFAPASQVHVVVQASDLSPIYSPAPFHARTMREERIAFTTAGHLAATGVGAHPAELENRGFFDPAVMPPSIAFAARGSATPDGKPIVGHHFALLDSDMVHEHSAVFVHLPDTGRPFAVLTFTGLVWGFSGMNADGLTWGFTCSDSLDNPLVGRALDAIFANLDELLANPDLIGLSKALAETTLNAAGVPVGMQGREVLEGAGDVATALDLLYRRPRTYGWNMLLADAAGGMAVVEVDSAVMAAEGTTGGETLRNEDGFQYYGPEVEQPGNLSPQGTPWASVGPDDLRMASHFQKNTRDIKDLSALMQMFAPRQQRQWTGFYFRSLHAFSTLGALLDERYGQLDVDGAIDLLRTPELVDRRDSMSAAVFEPARGVLHWAMGRAPATDAPFVELDLRTLDREGGGR
jgi:hypothetical protein